MLCNSGFVHDVMFSRNGATEPESSTTLLCRVRQVAATVECQTLWRLRGQSLCIRFQAC